MWEASSRLAQPEDFAQAAPSLHAKEAIDLSQRGLYRARG